MYRRILTESETGTETGTGTEIVRVFRALMMEVIIRLVVKMYHRREVGVYVRVWVCVVRAFVFVCFVVENRECVSVCRVCSGFVIGLF